MKSIIGILLLTTFWLGQGVYAQSLESGPVVDELSEAPLRGLNSVQVQEDTEPVKRLKALYASDPDFQNKVDLAFANVQDLPDGRLNPWRGKDVEDLYVFFNEWFYFLPNTEDGLDRIMQFAMLYYRNPYGLRVVREEPGLSWTKYFVEERGRYMDSAQSLAQLEVWLEDPATRMDEFIVPEGGFTSFNAFFAREIKPGARPVAGVTDNSVVVSPSDCVLNMIDNEITAGTQIPLKGRMSLSIEQLLDGSPYAKQFLGGTAMACFLMPDSYHYYHAPVSGTLVESKQDVEGVYFGMDDLPAMANGGNVGFGQDFSVFELFRHGYFVIETTQFGYVAVISVGLNTIGSVVFEDRFKEVDESCAVQLHKGEKLGHFRYGGSLVMMIFEPGRLESVKTRQGQQIGVLH